MNRLSFNWKAMAFAVGVTLCPAISQAAPGDLVFSETFDDEEAFNKWVKVDLNGGRTWEFFYGCAANMIDFNYETYTSAPADEWLISPEFTINGDNVYRLKFYTNAGYYQEKLQVALLTSTDPKTAVVIKDLSSFDGDQNVTVDFNMPSGTYRLGFYTNSDANHNRLEVDNVYVNELSSKNVPASAASLTVTPAELGKLEATVAFNTPSTTAAGQALSAISTVNVYRNGDATPAYVFTAPAVGTPLTWTDTNPINGFNTYKVEAVNEAGASVPVEATSFVGVDKICAIPSVVATQVDEHKVNVAWEAPTTTENNGYADFAAVRYNLMRNGIIVGEGLSSTSYQDIVPSNGSQEKVSYTAVAYVGSNDDATAPVQSNTVICGEPIKVAHKESFKNMATAFPWVQDGSCNDFDWTMVGSDEEDEQEVPVQDRDNGMMRAESKYGSWDDQSRLISPIFDLADFSNPVLTFYFFHAQSPWYDPDMDGANNDHLLVQYRTIGGEWVSIQNAKFFAAHDNQGWVKCEVSLPRIEGAFNFGFLSVSENESYGYRNMYIDNVTVDESAMQNDLALNAFNVDNKRVSPNETQTFTVNVFNKGGNAASDYQVVLKRNGETFSTANGTEVAPAASAKFNFEVKATVQDAQEEAIEWTAEVVFADDENKDNNTSDAISCSVRELDLATTTLRGEYVPQGIALNWDALQSVTATPKGDMLKVTDDFESYMPFITTNFGGWTTVDVDGAPTMVSSRIQFAYAHQGEPMAFQVFDTQAAGVWIEGNMDEAFEPHSGKSYLVSPSSDYPAENDDWLISERLDGRAQTINFFAKAASYDYEWIGVYASSTDKHIDSFVKVSEGDHVAVDDGWRNYSFELPEGTKYFAVRCMRRCVMLMVDDISYAKHDGGNDAATLVGYNVYRNGEKLNDQPVTATEWTDASTDINSLNRYHVSVVYEQGESPLSNEVIFEPSGINDVTLGVSVVAQAGVLNINAAHNVNVAIYTVDGKQVYAANGASSYSTTLSSGIYVVLVNGKAQKVVMK